MDQPFQFTADVIDTTNSSVTWSIANNTDGSLGSIDPNLGIYTPPAVIPTPNTVTIQVSTNADQSSTDSVVATIVSRNMLRFGENFQITNYGAINPCEVNTTAILSSTFSSGQHSVKIYQKPASGKKQVTYVFMVWADNNLGNPNNDIFFRQITFDPNNTGMICGGIIQVNAAGFTANRMNPSLAVHSNGDVYIAWQDNRDPLNPGTPKGDFDIYVAKGRFDNKLSGGSGTPSNGIVGFGGDVMLSDGTAGTEQTNPSVATEGGNIYAAWQDNQSGNFNIRFAKGTPTPATGTPPQNSFTANASVPINTFAAADQTTPTLVNSGGTFYVAWTDARNGNNDIFIAKSTNGGTSFIALIDPNDSNKHYIRVNDDTVANGFPDTADQTAPSLALDIKGYIYVTWQDKRNGNYDIFFAKSIDGGDRFDAATDPNNPKEHNVRVNDDTIANGYLDNADQAHPSITVEKTEPNAIATTPDKIYIAWQDDRWGSQDIITSKSMDGGNTFWTNSAPADNDPLTSPNSDSSIAVDTFGRAYLIWTGTSSSASDVFFTIGQ